MRAEGTINEQELPPRASTLVESLRDIGYSLQTALADVIDNSLTAGARKIELFAETHAESPSIGILDDGVGMDQAELLEAMRPGGRSPLESRSERDLGRFGLGLKTASFSQCRRLTVLTSRNGVVSTAVWDLDTVAARDRWVVEVPDSTDGIPWSDRLDGDGTLVVWQKLDRLVGLNGQDDRQDFVRQLDEAASHIEFVFHRFLSGRRIAKAGFRFRSMAAISNHTIPSTRIILLPSIIRKKRYCSTARRYWSGQSRCPTTTRFRRRTGDGVPARRDT